MLDFSQLLDSFDFTPQILNQYDCSIVNVQHMLVYNFTIYSNHKRLYELIKSSQYLRSYSRARFGKSDLTQTASHACMIYFASNKLYVSTAGSLHSVLMKLMNYKRHVSVAGETHTRYRNGTEMPLSNVVYRLILRYILTCTCVCICT